MTLFLLFGADWITVHIFNSPNSALPLKGYGTHHSGLFHYGRGARLFQGLGNMVPTSISQVIERVVNAVISVAASFAFMHWFANQETPAAYGAAGEVPWVDPFRRTGCLCLSDPADVCVPQTEHEGTAQTLRLTAWKGWSHVYTALFLTLTPIILSQFVYQLSGSVDNSMFGFLMSGKVSPRKNAFPCLVSTAASTACFPTYRWLWLLPWELP